MSNISKMELQQSIRTLHDQGWSQRRIARELGVHRLTVSRYIGELECTISQAGKVGRQSDCEAYRDLIKKGLEQGLSSERLRQDLVTNHGATISYDSVNRFVNKLQERDPEVIVRTLTPYAELRLCDIPMGWKTPDPEPQCGALVT